MGLYEKIKFLSERQKISIRKLEETLGYGNGTIRRWEKQTPGADKLEAVANFFDVSVDYLLGRTENPSISNEETSMAKQVMMRMDTDGLSEKELDEIESEMERFFSWRIEEIKRERGE